MAGFFVDWWGPKLALSHDETTNVAGAEDVALALNAIGIGTAPMPFKAAFGILALYIGAERALLKAMDKGNGVWMTIPWPAIWWGQWWIIVPTTR